MINLMLELVYVETIIDALEIAETWHKDTKKYSLAKIAVKTQMLKEKREENELKKI